jgi:electron transfer flavoprotein alpha/beta subunit
MATDTASGTVGAMVAELIDRPCVTAASQLDIADGRGTARRDLRRNRRSVSAAGRRHC